MPKFYSVFGGCLETDIEFPELRYTEVREPLWRFYITDRLPDRAQSVEIGVQHIYGEVHARLFRHEAGYRIDVDDTGRFDIDESGTTIVCEEKEGAWPDFVRAHLLGRVLATAVYSRGWMPLHGSAVQYDSGTIGFLAPKGFGKSTLALALARSGARLVTDDTLPIELSDPVTSWPGVHSVRIAADSLAAVGIAEADLSTREGKGVVTSLDDQVLATSPGPLAALYMISPREAPPDGATDFSELVTRERLPPVAATLAVLANFKLAKMIGSSETPELLKRAAVIAAGTPIYRLAVPRDLVSLSAVARVIAAWHARSDSIPASGTP